jgi:hypothetical protein
MKLLLKIFKIIAIIIIILFIALFSVTLIKHDKVAEIFLNELNKKVKTKVAVGSFRLSLFRKFPMASFEFKNIVIHSSSGFNKKAFKEVNTDTLLFAEVLSLEFKMTDLYKGEYNIENLNIVRGKMALFIDSVGEVNYEITDDTISSTGNMFSLNLKNIKLSDFGVLYFNKAINLKIESNIKSGRLRGEIMGKNVNIYAKSDAEVSNFQLYNTRVKYPTDIQFEINMQKSENGIVLKKGSLALENIGLALSGSVTDKNILNIALSGKSTDISGLKNYLSGKYLAIFNDYKPSGILKVDCKITGYIGKTVSPHIDINFEINKGLIEYAKSNVSAKNISLKGSLSNGSMNNPATSKLILNNISFDIGTSNYTGSFTLQNFLHPEVDLLLNGTLVFSDLKDFLSLPQISTSEGSIAAGIKLSGYLETKEKYSFSDLMELNPEANFNFNSFSIGLNNEKVKFDDIEGNIRLSKNLLADNLFITYKDQRIKIDGEFFNLPEWLAGQPVVLKAIADVNFNKLNPATFFDSKTTDSRGTVKSKSFVLPQDIIFDINLTIDSFRYKSFSAKDVSGRMTYKPSIVEINNFNLSALSGSISGDCFLTQGTNKSFVSKGNFNLKQINVNEAFKSFHNFGQTYLKAENIGGSLSGYFTILSVLDSILKPDINSLIVEGKYSLKDGELVNFDPVKELSSYIELSELENIKFSNLENEFFIRNNILTIPQMDIKSSAADLSINGNHNFNGDYEYHVKILLSEILSRKKRNNKKTGNASTDFGIVEDDGLGRTSLLLKLAQTGNNVKVSYDIAAAKGAIKKDFKTEKQNLKTILNEEYGWFRKDTVVKTQTRQPSPTPQKPRFRISWEESDTVK